MMHMPLEDIKQKIIEKTAISEEELDSKIKKKLDQLSGLISKEGAAHIIANELGVKLFEGTSGKLKINNILAGMRNVETAGKIMAVYEKREFQRGETMGKVASYLIGDETGSIRVVCWGDQADKTTEMKPGDIVRIISGYSRENNARKEIHINDKSKMIINPPDVSIGEVKTTIDYKRKKVQELEDQDRNIELLGTIVQLEALRFYEVCPECGKRARQRDDGFFCDSHNKVKPVFSYVCNISLDDGSGNIRVVLFRELVEKVLRTKAEEMTAIKNFPEKIEELKNNVLGEMVKVKGRVSKNELFNRMEFVGSDVDMNPNPDDEIKRVDEEIKAKDEVKSFDEI